ncbi:MAG: hypothetical protein ACI31C_01085 [Muribaculaceae bacterium]
MKKFVVNLFCIALVFSMTGLLYSCSDDDDNNVIDDEIDNPEYEIVDLPTEDQMEVTSIIDLYVPSTDGLSEVAQAIIRRCPAGYDYTACAILLTSNFIDTADDATLAQIKDFYDGGGMIIMDRPTPRNFKTLEAGMELDKIADPMEEHDDHEAYGIYAFNKHFDIYKLNDIFDEDGSEYQTYHYGTTVDEDGNTTPVEEYGEGVAEGQEEQPLTPYLAGLIADPLAHWMTENNIPDEWRDARKKQIIANSRGTMDDIIHAQSITSTWTHGVEEWWKDKCSDEIWETLKDRQTVFTTTTRVYVAYSYEEDTDYYLFDQTVWANNSHKWLGCWNRGGTHDHQGLYLYGIYIENNLEMGEIWGDFINYGLTLADFSPETVVGSQTYSTSTGFNIGGSAGLSPSGPSANSNIGINVSTSQSYSIPDLSVVSMCGDNETTKTNCKWEYHSRNHNYDVDWKGKATFHSPAQVSINTIKVGQSWVWKLTDPQPYDFYGLYLKYSIGDWMCADYRKWINIFAYKDWGCDVLFAKMDFRIKIILPNRDPEL